MKLREKYCRGLRQYFIDVSGDRVIIVQSSDNDLKTTDLGERNFIVAAHDNDIKLKALTKFRLML
jgi:hypothetical protein